MNKKKLLKTLGVVSLIGAIGIGSTFAYLTSTSNTVKNTFAVGDVTFDEEMGNGIMESKVERSEDTGLYVDADEENTWTSTGNTYEELVALETVYKDPTIFMGADSVDAWLFVRVYNAENDLFDNVNIDEDIWEKVGYGTGEDGSTYVDYAYYKVVEAGEVCTVFTEVTMSKDLAAEDLIPDIEIKASAIQALGFDDAGAAYVEVKNLMD